MENEVTATTAKPHEWVNDWDLLSPRFQSEATAYLQIIGVVVAFFLVRKRARALLPTPPTAAIADTVPSGTVSDAPASSGVAT